METIPGFVFAPRPVGSPRPAGAFFSAVVQGPSGPGAWQVRLDGRLVTVRSELELTVGQVLKLRLVSQTPDQWILQPAAAPPAGAPFSAGQDPPAELLAAFLSRGLSRASDQLSRWAQWAQADPGPWDRAGWAASLEARGWGPDSPAQAALEPWLAWQRALEEGRSPPPPQDDGFWDLWNSRHTSRGEPWLVVPLRWEWEGTKDAGLLQAHWNPSSASIDAWNLTAAPAGTSFRLEARPTPGVLELTWKFFREADRVFWKAQVLDLGAPISTEDLKVVLRVWDGVLGPGTGLRRGIDVQA